MQNDVCVLRSNFTALLLIYSFLAIWIGAAHPGIVCTPQVSALNYSPAASWAGQSNTVLAGEK